MRQAQEAALAAKQEDRRIRAAARVDMLHRKAMLREQVVPEAMPKLCALRLKPDASHSKAKGSSVVHFGVLSLLAVCAAGAQDWVRDESLLPFRSMRRAMLTELEGAGKGGGGSAHRNLENLDGVMRFLGGRVGIGAAVTALICFKEHKELTEFNSIDLSEA